MAIADELERLNQLHKSGALTAEEYVRAKNAVLNTTTTPAPPSPKPSTTPTPKPVASFLAGLGTGISWFAQLAGVLIGIIIVLVGLVYLNCAIFGVPYPKSLDDFWLSIPRVGRAIRVELGLA
jgi:hypothetical protein